jgi:PAS domain S-box-containing protein
MKNRRSLIKTFLFSMVLIMFVTIFSVGYFWISYEYLMVAQEADKMRKEYIEDQKAMIRHEVERTINYIEHRKSRTEERLKESLKEMVSAAHSIATNIYNENKDIKSDDEIKKMIKDALRPVRYNQGRGYFFAGSMDGTEELYPVNPELEGKNLLNFQDAKGNYVIKEEIEIVKKEKQGFVKAYWRKPGDDRGMIYPKISFVKYFEPFDWSIGTGEYLDDVEKDIQKEVLERLIKIRFGKEGYIFGSTYTGDPLFTNGKITLNSQSVWNLTDPHGVKIIQEQRKAVENPEGGFVNYVWGKLTRSEPAPKVAYVKGVPDWQWMIGAGVYLDEIEDAIAQKRLELRERIKDHVLKIFSVLAVLLIIIYGIAKYISSRVKAGFDTFSLFFEKAATQAAKIEIRHLHFSEFELLAHSANRMVDDRIQAEEELRKSEARFRQLADAAWEAIVIHDKGGLLLANNQFFEMFGYEEDELYNNDLVSLVIDSESLDMVKERINADNLDTYEVKGIRKDGTRFPIEIRVKMMEYQGRMARVASARDITETRKAQESLRKSEEKFSTIFKYSPDSIGITTLHEGIILDCNDNFLDTFKYTREEVIGNSAYHLKIWADPDKRRFYVGELKDKGEVINYETEFQAKDGTIIPGLISARMIEIDGEACILAITRDMTVYKHAEKEKAELRERLSRSKKMEALGLLAGGVAHDLNNILSGIVSYPELILMNLPQDDKLRKPMETIRSSGMRAAAVVQDLVTVARGIASTRTVMNLNLIVKEYLSSPEFKELEFRYPAVIFKTALDPDLLNINCSPVHVRKSLMNLVVNAAEAVKEAGSVVISTENRYVENPVTGYDEVRRGEFAVMSVSDNGSGISSKDIERIFEPFYTKKVMGRSGTGLGLTVVWNTVQDHDGYINVNTGDKGTTFELYFPVTREKASEREKSLPLEDYMGKGEHILVVDDEEIQRDIASQLLTRLGYSAAAVSGGEAAVEYLKTHKADLIVLDMIMPGMNGRDTYQEIIKIHPRQKAVIASGFSETEEVKEAQRLGAGQYIRKPYTLEKIGTAIRDELRR